MWIVMTMVCTGIIILRQTVRRAKFVSVPEVTRPLLFLTLVVVCTSVITGGIGFNIIGSGMHGGKRIAFILAAILGYFVMTSQRIPVSKARLYVNLYILGYVTAFATVLVALSPDKLSWLSIFFPMDSADLFVTDSIEDNQRFFRSVYISFSAAGMVFFMIAHYGLRQILDRFKLGLVLAALLFLAALGGFRSMILLIGLVLLFQFFLEKIHRSRHFMRVGVAGLTMFVALLAFSNRMPLAVQRSLSFIPILEFDQRAKNAAEATTVWRIEMWTWLLPEIPRHLLVGKGYTFSARENDALLMLPAKANVDKRLSMMINGDYHSGPLSVIIPLGIWGCIAVLWFWGAALWVLVQNFKYSLVELKTINTLFLSMFIARILIFLIIYGGLPGDLMHFTGLVGLSISLNGGVRTMSTDDNPDDH